MYMKRFDIHSSYFNGKLHSLKHLCNKYGTDIFSLSNGFKINRVEKLYNSDLDGNHYIEKVLLSDDFERDFAILVDKNNFIDNIYSNFCGVGIKKIKIMLDKLSECDIIAESLLIALEIEEINMNAKRTNDSYIIYDKKKELILNLVDLCNQVSINYGFQDSDIPDVRSIVYFDLACGQLSWHTMLDRTGFKMYDGKWDGKKFATLNKIEKFIKENYL